MARTYYTVSLPEYQTWLYDFIIKAQTGALPFPPFSEKRYGLDITTFPRENGRIMTTLIGEGIALGLDTHVGGYVTLTCESLGRFDTWVAIEGLSNMMSKLPKGLALYVPTLPLPYLHHQNMLQLGFRPLGAPTSGMLSIPAEWCWGYQDPVKAVMAGLHAALTEVP